jgi:hypothetical protein
LTSVVGNIAGQIAGGGKLGTVLTRQTAAAICLANRQRGVRAIGGKGSREILENVEAVGANLLVLDPMGQSLFDLQRTLMQFVAGAPRACPAAFVNDLG